MTIERELGLENPIVHRSLYDLSGIHLYHSADISRKRRLKYVQDILQSEAQSNVVLACTSERQRIELEMLLARHTWRDRVQLVHFSNISALTLDRSRQWVLVLSEPSKIPFTAHLQSRLNDSPGAQPNLRTYAIFGALKALLLWAREAHIRDIHIFDAGLSPITISQKLPELEGIKIQPAWNNHGGISTSMPQSMSPSINPIDQQLKHCAPDASDAPERAYHATGSRFWRPPTVDDTLDN